MFYFNIVSYLMKLLDPFIPPFFLDILTQFYFLSLVSFPLVDHNIYKIIDKGTNKYVQKYKTKTV